jgi:methionine-rich copper-binding protein CopC
VLPHRFDPGVATWEQALTIKSGACRVAALLGLSAVWLLLSCGPVLAHARLVETYPANGEALAEPPEQVQLQFNEPVEAEFDPIGVYDQEGERVDEDDARVSPDDRRLLVADLGELSEGSYTVEWRIASADGHPIDGEYEFAMNASAAGTGAGNPIASIERSAEQDEADSRWGGALVLIFGVLLVCTLAVVGLVMLRWRRRAE